MQHYFPLNIEYKEVSGLDVDNLKKRYATDKSDCMCVLPFFSTSEPCDDYQKIWYECYAIQGLCVLSVLVFNLLFATSNNNRVVFERVRYK
jgi:hypothetical protein